LLLEHGLSVSLETVYRLVLEDKKRAGQLYRYLRHEAKPSRKRYGGKNYCGKIPGWVDIAERPAIVDTRSRVGVGKPIWSSGRGHKGSLVTLPSGGQGSIWLCLSGAKPLN